MSDEDYQTGCYDAALWMLEACIKESFNYCRSVDDLRLLRSNIDKLISKQISETKKSSDLLFS